MVDNSFSTATRPQFAPVHAAPNWLVRAAGVAVVVALLFGLQFLLTRNYNPYIIQAIALGGINIILAVSLNLINGVTGQFSLGHAGFMAVGAYSAAAFTKFAGPYLALPPALILAIAIVIGASAAGVAGFVVGLPSLRLRGDYLAIVTLGFNQIIISVFQNADIVGAATGFNGIAHLADLKWVFGGVIACVFCVRNLANSQLGRSMKAIRDDEVAAEAVGINTTGIKVLAFVVSAMWAGVAGALQVHIQGFAQPESFNFVKSVEIVVMVVLGGLGSITGSVFSASALKFLEESLRNSRSLFWIVPLLGVLGLALTGWRAHKEGKLAVWARGAALAVAILASLLWFANQNRPYLETNKGALRYVIYALILIGMMLVRPEGLLGRWELSLRRRKPPLVDAGVR